VAAFSTALLALAQIVLGAQLRHVSAVSSHSVFRVIVLGHLFVALMLLVHAGVTWRRVRNARVGEPWLTVPALLVLLMVFVQIGLGAATWIVKYSLPSGLSGWAAGYTIEAEGMLQALTVTAHVATGSLILAASTLLALSAFRFVLPISATVATSVGSLVVARVV
jgi:cytochrome c oxidase assembly protein subunit 15